MLPDLCIFSVDYRMFFSFKIVIPCRSLIGSYLIFFFEHYRYTEQMEEMFDEAYDRYMAKKEGSAKQRKRARQAHAEKLEVTKYHCLPLVFMDATDFFE